MALQGILFDLDGTLVEFQIDYMQARKKVINILEAAGYPPNVLQDDHYVLKMLDKADTYFSKNGYSTQEIQKIREKVDLTIAKIEHKAAVKAKAIKGMQEVLQFCQKRKLKLGIVTLNTTQNALTSLKKVGFTSYFQNSEYIIGRDRVKKLKPHPSHPKMALDTMNLKASDVILIGDHPSDIKSAVYLGMRSIALISEKYPASEFKTNLCVPHATPAKPLLKILCSFMT